MDTIEKATSSGTQAIERSVLLLRVIASQGSRGARIGEIIEWSQLPRPTIYRLLSVLQREGLLEYNNQKRRYRIGPTMYEFGLSAPSPIERIDRYRPALKWLAAYSDDTAYLVMRTGDEAVCLAIEEGSFPIRARTFEIGARRPLGLGAAGLALIAELPDEQIDEITLRKGQLLQNAGVSVASLKQRINRTRSLGYAHSENTITQHVTGIGFTIPASKGLPFLAFSIAAISPRMPAERMPKLKAAIEKAIEMVPSE